MPRHVSYRIDDGADGRFDVVAVLYPDRIFRQDGFVTLAEAEEWIDGLRVLMAALGAPVVHADVDRTDAILSADDLARHARTGSSPEL